MRTASVRCFVVSTTFAALASSGCDATRADARLAWAAAADRTNDAVVLEANVGAPWRSPDGRAVVYTTLDEHVVWRSLVTGERKTFDDAETGYSRLTAVRPDGIVFETHTAASNDVVALAAFDWNGKTTGARTAPPPGLASDHASVAGFAIDDASGAVVVSLSAGGLFEIRRGGDVVQTAPIAGMPADASPLRSSLGGAYVARFAADASGALHVVSARAENGATAIWSAPLPGAATWLEDGAIADGALFETADGVLFHASFATGAVTTLSNAPVPTEKAVVERDDAGAPNAIVFLEGQPHGSGPWALRRWDSASHDPAATLATGTGRVANGGNYREVPAATSSWIGADLVAVDSHVSLLPSAILFDVVTTTYVVPRAGGEPRGLCDSCLVGLNGTDTVVHGKFTPGQTAEDVGSGASVFVEAPSPPGDLTSLFLTADRSRLYRFWTAAVNPNTSTVYDFTIDAATFTGAAPAADAFAGRVAMSFDMTNARGDAAVVPAVGDGLLFRSPFGDLVLVH